MEKWANGSLGGRRAKAVQLGNALGALEWGWEGGGRWVQEITALSEWSLVLAVIRGMASLSLLVLRGTLSSCPFWSKVLNSRNYLPDNCCTEGWSCVLNNCAWMVSTTLLKRRLGPVRREEAQMAVRGVQNESSCNTGWRERVTNIFPSVSSLKCTYSIAMLHLNAQLWGTIMKSQYKYKLHHVGLSKRKDGLFCKDRKDWGHFFLIILIQTLCVACDEPAKKEITYFCKKGEITGPQRPSEILRPLSKARM